MINHDQPGHFNDITKDFSNLGVKEEVTRKEKDKSVWEGQNTEKTIKDTIDLFGYFHLDFLISRASASFLRPLYL